ncbi:hypothetical protein ACHAWF_006558, partial [Thalassiosira exigua]
PLGPCIASRRPTRTARAKHNRGTKPPFAPAAAPVLSLLLVQFGSIMSHHLLDEGVDHLSHHAGGEAIAEAAAVAIPTLPSPSLDVGTLQVLLESVQQLQAGQSHQTDLIQRLQKSVLTSRSMINELVVVNNELKEELLKIKSATQCDNCKKKEVAFAAQTMLSVAGQTPDEEIDAIIEARRRKNSWPVKHSTLNCFSCQQDLVKVRFHHSEKYHHVPVRIPKTEKNKGMFIRSILSCLIS